MMSSNLLRNRRSRVPLLIQVLGVSAALGASVGVLLVSLLLLSDLAGLKDLIAQSSEPYLALFLLYFFNMLTFSSVAMGITIMRLPSDSP
jgi:hypothetical protein